VVPILHLFWCIPSLFEDSFHLTAPRFYEDPMGLIVGNATHATRAVVLQYLASSSQCPRSRYVLYEYPVRVNDTYGKRCIAVSLDSDVDTNKELVAHGYSNLLAGLVGTVPNYLVYVNTLLCVRYPHYFVDYLSHKFFKVLSRRGNHATVGLHVSWCDPCCIICWNRANCIHP